MKMSTDVQRYNLNGETMGTRYTAVLYAAAGIDTDEIGQRLAHAVSRVDRQMSTWKADSDLNRLNAAAEQEWLPVPKELSTVLAAALRVSQQSGGAFDIAVGDLVQAWASAPANRRSPRKHSRCHCHARDSPPARRWWWTRNAIGCANGRR